MLQIRQYRASDHDEVWYLHLFALEHVGANPGSGIQDIDLHSVEETYLADKGEFLVGFFENKFVAMGALKRISSVKAEIKRMRVHPDFQRQGFGQAILNRLEMRAQDLGYKTLCLDTTIQQIGARKLYEKNGYVEIERQKISGFNVIFFEKQLLKAGIST